MPNVATVSVAITSGHDNCPPVKATSGQSVMDINGNLVQVIGDEYEMHSCPIHPPHTPKASQGSSIMDINGIPVVLEGHKVADGGCTDEHVVVVGESLMDVEC